MGAGGGEDLVMPFIRRIEVDAWPLQGKVWQTAEHNECDQERALPRRRSSVDDGEQTGSAIFKVVANPLACKEPE